MPLHAHQGQCDIPLRIFTLKVFPGRVYAVEAGYYFFDVIAKTVRYELVVRLIFKPQTIKRIH